MARPIKHGLDYFPLDVDTHDNEKIELLEAKYGPIGFYTLVKLWQRIYKHSFYINYSEDFLIVFSKKIWLKFDEVKTIMDFCLEKRLFNKNLFDKYKILTSSGIQKRWLRGMEGRTKIFIHKPYWIIDETEIFEENKLKKIVFTGNLVEETPISDTKNPEETRVFTGENTQNKKKKSKEKYKKGEGTTCNSDTNPEQGELPLPPPPSPPALLINKNEGENKNDGNSCNGTAVSLPSTGSDGACQAGDGSGNGTEPEGYSCPPSLKFIEKAFREVIPVLKEEGFMVKINHKLHAGKFNCSVKPEILGSLTTYSLLKRRVKRWIYDELEKIEGIEANNRKQLEVGSQQSAESEEEYLKRRIEELKKRLENRGDFIGRVFMAYEEKTGDHSVRASFQNFTKSPTEEKVDELKGSDNWKALVSGMDGTIDKIEGWMRSWPEIDAEIRECETRIQELEGGK